MRSRRSPLWVLAAIALAPACRDGGGAEPAVQAEVAPGPTATAAAPSYDDSTAGLEALFRDLQRALSADDQSEAARLVASLRLPDERSWFVATFGPDLGERLAGEHAPFRADIGLLADILAGKLASASVQIRAERHERPRDPAATGYQSAALTAMKTRRPLYSLRLIDGEQIYHLWSFAHVDGSFRYVGKLTAAAGVRPPRSGPDGLEHRLRDAAKLGAAGDR